MRLEKLDGSYLSLGELRGRVVLVTVISTWSDPALLEVPPLKALHKKYARDDVEIVCVVLEEPKIAAIFAKTFEIPYIVTTAEDPAELTSKDGPFGAITIVPTSILLDRDGRIAARMEGIWPPDDRLAKLDRLVASDRSQP
jgi:thiol-disulfide isomerase/thioredoxin